MEGFMEMFRQPNLGQKISPKQNSYTNLKSNLLSDVKNETEIKKSKIKLGKNKKINTKDDKLKVRKYKKRNKTKDDKGLKAKEVNSFLAWTQKKSVETNLEKKAIDVCVGDNDIGSGDKDDSCGKENDQCWDSSSEENENHTLSVSEKSAFKIKFSWSSFSKKKDEENDEDKGDVEEEYKENDDEDKDDEGSEDDDTTDDSFVQPLKKRKVCLGLNEEDVMKVDDDDELLIIKDEEENGKKILKGNDECDMSVSGSDEEEIKSENVKAMSGGDVLGGIVVGSEDGDGGKFRGDDDDDGKLRGDGDDGKLRGDGDDGKLRGDDDDGKLRGDGDDGKLRGDDDDDGKLRGDGDDDGLRRSARKIKHLMNYKTFSKIGYDDDNESNGDGGDDDFKNYKKKKSLKSKKRTLRLGNVDEKYAKTNMNKQINGNKKLNKKIDKEKKNESKKNKACDSLKTKLKKIKLNKSNLTKNVSTKSVQRVVSVEEDGIEIVEDSKDKKVAAIFGQRSKRSLDYSGEKKEKVLSKEEEELMVRKRNFLFSSCGTKRTSKIPSKMSEKSKWSYMAPLPLFNHTTQLPPSSLTPPPSSLSPPPPHSPPSSSSQVSSLSSSLSSTPLSISPFLAVSVQEMKTKLSSQHHTTIPLTPPSSSTSPSIHELNQQKVRLVLKQIIKNKPTFEVFSMFNNLKNKQHYFSTLNTNDPILWTDKYRPIKWENFVGSRSSFKRVHDWLKECKRKMPEISQNDLLEEMSNSSERVGNQDDSRDSLYNNNKETNQEHVLVLEGVCGVGKTAVVHAVASQLDFKVIEVNASSLRDGRHLMTQLQEATQSHQISTTVAGLAAAKTAAATTSLSDVVVVDDNEAANESDNVKSDMDLDNDDDGGSSNNTDDGDDNNGDGGDEGSSCDGESVESKICINDEEEDNDDDKDNDDDMETKSVKKSPKKNFLNLFSQVKLVSKSSKQDNKKKMALEKNKKFKVTKVKLETKKEREGRKKTKSQLKKIKNKPNLNNRNNNDNNRNNNDNNRNNNDNNRNNNNNTKVPKPSLILFDEADISFEADRGFYTTLQRLCRISKRPIIVTCNHSFLLPKPLHHSLLLSIKPSSMNDLCCYLQLLGLVEGVIWKRSTLLQLLDCCNCDVRRCLLQLQTAVESVGTQLERGLAAGWVEIEVEEVFKETGVIKMDGGGEGVDGGTGVCGGGGCVVGGGGGERINSASSQNNEENKNNKNACSCDRDDDDDEEEDKDDDDDFQMTRSRKSIIKKFESDNEEEDGGDDDHEGNGDEGGNRGDVDGDVSSGDEDDRALEVMLRGDDGEMRNELRMIMGGDDDDVNPLDHIIYPSHQPTLCQSNNDFIKNYNNNNNNNKLFIFNNVNSKRMNRLSMYDSFVHNLNTNVYTHECTLKEACNDYDEDGNDGDVNDDNGDGVGKDDDGNEDDMSKEEIVEIVKNERNEKSGFRNKLCLNRNEENPSNINSTTIKLNNNSTLNIIQTSNITSKSNITSTSNNTSTNLTLNSVFSTPPSSNNNKITSASSNDFKMLLSLATAYNNISLFDATFSTTQTHLNNNINNHYICNNFTIPGTNDNNNNTATINNNTAYKTNNILPKSNISINIFDKNIKKKPNLNTPTTNNNNVVNVCNNTTNKINNISQHDNNYNNNKGHIGEIGLLLYDTIIINTNNKFNNILNTTNNNNNYLNCNNNNYGINGLNTREYALCHRRLSEQLELRGSLMTLNTRIFPRNYLLFAPALRSICLVEKTNEKNKRRFRHYLRRQYPLHILIQLNKQIFSPPTTSSHPTTS